MKMLKNSGSIFEACVSVAITEAALHRCSYKKVF